MKYNFNNKTFALVDNSSEGKVNSDTVFKYKQDGDVVTADYYGGTISYGKIIAVLKDDELDMLYQCVTTDNELKAGKAIAKISITDNNRLRLKLNWQWLNKGEEKGTSEYIEVGAI